MVHAAVLYLEKRGVGVSGGGRKGDGGGRGVKVFLFFSF